MSDTREVAIGGRPFTFADAAHYGWFWNKVAAGTWEPGTVARLAERVGPSTLFIDVGAWIGPTVLAAARAKRIVAVEPDPLAMGSLLRTLRLNPDVAAKTALRAHAVGAEDGAIDLWADRFGESVTSPLPTRGGQRLTVLAMGAERFLDAALGEDADILIKIDIEGGEYAFVPALCAALAERGATADLHVSLHGSFFADGPARNAALTDALRAYGTVEPAEGARRPDATLFVRGAGKPGRG